MSLNTLNLSKCVSITDISLRSIALLTKLEVLFMSNCTKLEGLCFESLKFPNLQVLNISSSSIKDKQLIQVAEAAPNLTLLNVGKTVVTCDSINSITLRCPLLKLLDLTDCKNVISIEAILDNCKCLRILDIPGCPYISADEIKQIGIKLPTLTKLDIGGCPQVDDEVIAGLCCSKQLSIINLQGCNLTFASVPHLQQLASNIMQTQGKRLRMALFPKQQIYDALVTHPLCSVKSFK